MDYQKLVTQVGSEQWANLLKPFMVEDNSNTEVPYNKIATFLKEQKDNKVVFYPEGKNVFKCFRATPLEKVRVVLLGQDPYPKEGFADGLCFSTDNVKTPPSLEKIFEGIENDAYNGIDFQKPNRTNSLVSWADQGVLLLNTALTVKANEPGSHTKEWEPFTQFIISSLEAVKKNLIWVTLGAPAREYVKNVNAFSNFIYNAEHPANAAREKREWKHANVFTKVNLAIRLNNLGEEIKW